MTADARERDARARWVAQTDFERPVALEAGAGTGKTAALVARVVAWCLGPGWERARASASGVAPGVESDVASGVAPGVESDAEPEQRAVRVLRRVAAITFTEAAAAEMAERVGQAFAALESGQAPVGLDVCALSDPPAERSARAAALRTGLDQLRVQTIHSFCRRLLAEHPLEAGLHPRFAVDADESGQKAVVREVLEAALPALFETSEALLELVRAGETPGDLEAALLFLVGEGVSPAALGRDPLADERVKELIGRARPPIDAFVALEGGRLVALGSRAPLVSSLVAGLAQLGERLRDCEPTLEGLEVLLAWLRECDFSDSDLQKWEDRLKQWETKRSFGKSADRAVGEDLEGLVAEYKEEIKARLGRDFPEDPVKQLWGAIGAVFSSWNN
ncbi:MAG: UvrD-helicase domain-containing protein, partial [Myxococcota bacterium]|nr:UvrD-helicase domain-containing protein [Myxococcota bacterium]